MVAPDTRCQQCLGVMLCTAPLRRRQAGEALPPPPKTAIAGPEYFGLTHPQVQAALEALDPDRLCADYWAGKQACSPAPWPIGAMCCSPRPISRASKSSEAEGLLLY